MNHRHLFLLFLSIILTIISSCSKGPEYKIHSIQGKTMGTTYSVKLSLLKDQVIDLKSLKDEIDFLLKSLNAQVSTYIDQSLISKFNRGESISLADDFIRIFQVSKSVYLDTSGSFDPTVMPLVNFWGFGPEKKAKYDESELKKILKTVGMDKLKLQNKLIYKKVAGVELDFSAVAKGYGVDKIIDFLKTKKLASKALVEIGGEICAMGLKNAIDPWMVGIERPTKERVVKITLGLKDQCMATSGNYRNFYLENGEMVSHTIDPLTGRPVKNKLASVTVILSQAAKADAYATAFMAMGTDKAVTFAKEKNMTAFFQSYRKGKIVDTATKGFYKQLELGR